MYENSFLVLDRRFGCTSSEQRHTPNNFKPMQSLLFFSKINTICKDIAFTEHARHLVLPSTLFYCLEQGTTFSFLMCIFTTACKYRKSFKAKTTCTLHIIRANFTEFRKSAYNLISTQIISHWAANNAVVIFGKPLLYLAD